MSGVVGVGLDVVDIERFRTVLERTPGIIDRVFTDGERDYAQRSVDPTERFAVRFAAKEAVMKALGVGLGACALSDIEIVSADSGAPSLVLHEGAATLAADRGVVTWRISLSHSTLVAEAIALALDDGRVADDR